MFSRFFDYFNYAQLNNNQEVTIDPETTNDIWALPKSRPIDDALVPELCVQNIVRSKIPIIIDPVNPIDLDDPPPPYAFIDFSNTAEDESESVEDSQINFKTNLIVISAIASGILLWPFCLLLLSFTVDIIRNQNYTRRHKIRTRLCVAVCVLGILVGIVEWGLVYYYFAKKK